MAARVRRKRCVLAHPTDNVVTVVFGIAEGEAVTERGRSVVVREHIPAWHKVAIEDIAEGQPVRKYGQRIGVATRLIRAGRLVHCHNLETEQDTKREVAS